MRFASEKGVLYPWAKEICMIVTPYSPYIQKGRRFFQVTASEWSELRNLIMKFSQLDRDRIKVVLREPPLFKKRGHDHIRVYVDDDEGAELMRKLYEEYGAIPVGPRTLELAIHQMKLSRMKEIGESLSEEELDYMRKGDRLRLSALLRDGEWSDRPEMKGVRKHAWLDWQAKTKQIPLERNSHLQFIPEVQIGKGARKEKILQRMLRIPLEEMLEDAKKTGNFDPVLMEYGDLAKFDVLGWKIENGIIPRDQLQKYAAGSWKDLLSK